VIEVGQVNKLIVERETSSGYYLKDSLSEEEVFMPPALAPLRVQLGDELQVFVYPNPKGQLVANSDIPSAVVGEYALMTVIDVQEFGAFLDWGIDKDLLIPGNEQKIKLRKFDDALVRVCLEEDTGRVYGTTKLGSYIEDSDFDIDENDVVDVVPVIDSPLGFRAIINRKFIGMIYRNEVFEHVVLGRNYKGIVKKIRVDGLVDVSLQPLGVEHRIDPAKQKILEMLNDCGGESSLHDKSSPEDIKALLGMSKKTFKSALGGLYKEKKVEILSSGIKLVKNEK